MCGLYRRCNIQCLRDTIWVRSIYMGNTVIVLNTVYTMLYIVASCCLMSYFKAETTIMYLQLDNLTFYTLGKQPQKSRGFRGEYRGSKKVLDLLQNLNIARLSHYSHKYKDFIYSSW